MNLKMKTIDIMKGLRGTWKFLREGTYIEVPPLNLMKVQDIFSKLFTINLLLYF